MDQHNQKLIAATHPPEWKNPLPPGRYNIVVIGGGTAGLVTAAGAAGLGAKVALIERGLLGGDCLNVGCVPSKAMIRCARAAAEVRDAGRFGVRVSGEVSVDFAAVMERMRGLRASIAAHDSAERFRGLGVDVYLGEACFTGPDTVEVSGQTLQFARACIATGARPAAPDVPGLRDAGYLTNETVFNLTELPRRLAVIGTGPIGCELAQTFARLGSEVWMIDKEHGILHREDADAAGIVWDAMQRDGVKVLCCGRELKVGRVSDGKRLTVDSHDQPYDLTVDEIVVAAGRTPNVEGLNLEAAGVQYDEQGIHVDDTLRTANHRIYAAGDICTPYKFTHHSDAHARIVIRNALFPLLPKAKASKIVLPWCTYTDPEIAHVGREKLDDLEHDTITIPLADIDRAKLDGEIEGLLKVHVKRGSDRILAATLVARHAGEMISEITAAMTNGIGLKGLANTIHCYPTQAEAIRRAGDKFNRGRLTPTVKWLLEKWMSWQR